MLKTNLSTRPFYNERGVHMVLAAAAFIAAILTIVNLTQIVLLSRQQSRIGARIEAADSRAAELRTRAGQLRQSVNTARMSEITEAAREANGIIGQRLFSWTELLNRLETTLPDDVRITSLRPRIEKDGTVTVQMTVTGRNAEDISAFMANLEQTQAFSGVFPREDAPMEDGLVEALVEGKYAMAH